MMYLSNCACVDADDDINGAKLWDNAAFRAAHQQAMDRKAVGAAGYSIAWRLDRCYIRPPKASGEEVMWCVENLDELTAAAATAAAAGTGRATGGAGYGGGNGGGGAAGGNNGNSNPGAGGSYAGAARAAAGAGGSVRAGAAAGGSGSREA